MRKRVNKKRKPLISALEPRILFDGAAVTTAVDVIDNSTLSNDSNNDTTADSTIDIAPTSDQTTVPMNSGDVMIITTDVPDYEIAAQNFSENFRVIVLDESSNDLQTQILDATKDLDSELNVHILAANQTRDRLLVGSFDSVNDLINSFDSSDSKIYDIDTLVEQDITPSGEGQVIIIDEAVSYTHDMLDSIPSDWTVITINSQEDGLTQILEKLDGITNLSAIHIFSHGNSGELILGNLVLNSQTLQDRSSDLALLGQHLSQTGDILLYGCDIASGYVGEEFVNLLATLTSADIAASDDATGSYITSADFELETTTGNIESNTLNVDTNGTTLGSITYYNYTISRNAPRLIYQASGEYATGWLSGNDSNWVDFYTSNRDVSYFGVKWVKAWFFSFPIPWIYRYSYGTGVRYTETDFTLQYDSEYNITSQINTYLENQLGGENSSWGLVNYALYKGTFDKYDPMKNLVTASEGWAAGLVYHGDLEAGDYTLVTSFDGFRWWPDIISLMTLNNYAEQMYGSGTLTVQNLNHAPVIQDLTAQTIDGAGDKSITLANWGMISDADGDEITTSAFLLNGSTENALPYWLSFNENSLVLTGNPPANTGTITVRLKAYDGQEYGYKDIQLTFTNDNDQPIVSNLIPDQAWDGEGSFTYQVPTDTFTDADPDADSFTYSAKLESGASLPNWLSISSTGVLSGNPPAGQGDLNIIVTVDDGSGQANATQSDMFTLKILNPNDIPVVTNITKTINEDTTYTFSLSDFIYSAGDTHADDDTTAGVGKDIQSIRIVELPLNGTLWLDSNNDGVQDSGEEVLLNQTIVTADITKLKFTPNKNWAGHGVLTPLEALLTGPDSFKWVANDGYDDSNIATTTINVLLINDDPELSFSEGKSLNIRPNGGANLLPVYVDEGLNLIDPDSAYTDDVLFDTIFGISVTIIDSTTNSFVAGDTLSLTGDTTGFSVSYDSVNGILTIESTTGGATAAQYQTLLRTLQFSSTDTTNNHDRTLGLSFRTQDVGSKSSAYFDGVNDYIETMNASIPTTGDFTVSVWSKLDTNDLATNGQYTMFGQGDNSSHIFLQIQKIDTTYNLRIGNDWTITGLDSILSDGKWHQYTVVRSGSGATDGALYIDGKYIGSGDVKDTITAGYGLRIGRLYDQTINSSSDWSGYWKGSISDIRVYNKVLSSVDIQQSLSSQLTGSEVGLKAWYKLESDYNNYAGGYFSGTSSEYVDLGDISGLDNSGFTLEATVNVATGDETRSWQRIFDLGNGENSNNIILAFEGTSGRITLDLYGNSVNEHYQIVTVSTFPTDQDVHVTAVWDGTVGKIFFNGIEQAVTTTYNTGSFVVNNVTRTDSFVGKSNWIADAYFKGTISEIRIWNDIRTQDEIQNSIGQLSTASQNDASLIKYEIIKTSSQNAVVFKDAGYGYSIKTGHYYYFNTTAQTQSSADAIANSSTYAGENGYLINMDDASLSAEEKEVAKLMSSLNGDVNFWTGLYRSGAWYWGSGPDSDVAFTHDNVTEGLDDNPSQWNTNYGPAGWWGRFGNSWQSSPWVTTNNLQTQITFTYYSWDSWDGERFRIQLNGYDLFSIYRTYNSGTNAASWGGTAYINGMPITYSVSRSSSWNMGASGWDDQYFSITVNIPQNFASSVRMSFGAYTNQSISDESAEIRYYQVRTVNPEYQKDRAYMNSVSGYIDNTYSTDYRYSLIEYGNRGEVLSAPSLFATTNSALPDKYVNETRTITVRETNNAPTQTASWTISNINEDTQYNFKVSDFTSQFSDIDGDTLNKITITSIPDSSKGILELNGVTLSNNAVISVGDLDKLILKPNVNYFGDISFNYTSSDGYLDTNEATVTITIDALNDAPVINTSNTYTITAIDEDIVNVDNTGTLVSDMIIDGSITDADGSAIEAIAITKVNNTYGTWQYSLDSGSSWTNISNISGAIVNIESTALLLDSDSLLRFIPNANYNGTSNITFKAWDKSSGSVGGTTNVNAVGGNNSVSSDSVSASITINAVNDTPETLDNSITMDEDTVYTFTLDDFAFSDIDSGDTLASIEISNITGAGTFSLTGTVTKTQIEAGLLTFTPVANAYGSSYATFDFSVNDGTDNSITKTFTINVTDTNDAPTAISWNSGGNVAENAISTESSVTVVGTLSATDPDTGDTLRFVQLTNNKFTIKPDGTVQLAISPKDLDGNSLALLDYELNQTETIRVKVIDSQGLSYEKDITVNVTDVIENTPTLYTNSFYIQKGDTITITEEYLNTVDADTLDKNLVYTVKQYPSGGTFFIDNNGNNVYDEGEDDLLAPENADAPENVQNFTQADILAGKIKFTKDSTQVSGKLDLEVTDGTTTKQGILVAITSTPPELATAIDDQEWKTTGAQTFAVPSSTFFDADYDVLTLSAKLSNGSDLPSWLTFDASINTFSGTPTGLSDGQSIEITVTATDGRTTPASDTFIITFKEVITKPVIENPLPSYIEFDGSGEKSYVIPSDTFTDPLAGTLTYSATGMPSWLSFDSNTRTFSGNPPANAIGGPYYLTLTADNGTSTTSTALKLYVSDPNDIPTTTSVINDITISDSNTHSYTVDKSTYSDADGDDITLNLVNATGEELPGWIVVTKDTNGNLVYDVIAPGGSGTIDLIVIATDGNGGEARSEFTLTYSGGVNKAPQVLTDAGTSYMQGGILITNPSNALDTFNIIQGKTATITTDYLNENDPDDDGIGLTYTITTATSYGTMELWEDTNNDGVVDNKVKDLTTSDTFTQDDLDNGRIKYTHTASHTGNDKFIFNLADGGENSVAAVVGATFNIVVNEVPAATVVTEILRYTPSNELTNEDEISFKVKFSEAVLGVDSSDFTLNGTLASNASIIEVQRISGNEYLVTLGGAGIADANGTLGIELSSNAVIYNSSRDLLDKTVTPITTEQFTLDNIGPSVSYARSGANDIIITFNENISSNLTLDDLSIDQNATLLNLVKVSANSYKVTVTKESGNTNDPILTVKENSVLDTAQNYNSQSTYTIKGEIDITSDADWIPLLTGDNFDPNDDTQARSDGVDLVGNIDNSLLYTQYNGSELAFRVRMESNNEKSGTFYLIGIDGTNDGSIDFFMGVFLSSNGREQTVKFYEAGNGANTSPSTTSFNVRTAVTPSNTLIDVHGTGSDLDSNGNEDGFVSFKFNAQDFVDFANGAGGLSGYTIDSALSFILVTATQTNSINGDIGGIDGNSNEPWSNILTPTVFSNIAPSASDTIINMNENSSYTINTRDLVYIDADGDSLNSIIITVLPTNGVLLLNDSYVTLNQEISATDIENGNLKFVPDTNENGEAYASFDFKVNDGKSNSADSYTMTFNVADVNDSPVISNLDSDVQYWSNANEAVSLDPFEYAIISDADNLDFNGGILTITVSGGNAIDNNLSVIDNGNITISGNEISYSGTVIGTIDDIKDGTYGSDLQITFNSDATQEKITELVKALRFTYEGDEFISPVRTITMQITDGDGGESNLATLTMVGPPVYQINGYEDVTQTFSSSDYDISSDVKITILNDNNGTWYYLDSNNGNAKTLLSLNDIISASEFDTLTYEPNSDIYGDGIDSLSYKSVGTANSVGFDSNGLSYIQPTLIINLAAVNDGATLDLNGIESGTTISTTFTEINGVDTTSNDIYLTNGHVSISDVDGSTLTGLKLSANSFSGDELIIGSTTISLTQNNSGTITISGQTYNYTVQYGSDSSIVEFSSSAIDSSNYENLLNVIKFNNTIDSPNETARVFNISANDGEGYGNSVTSTVNVVAVNDTPIMNDIKISSQYDWNLDIVTTLVPSVTLADIDGTIASVTLTINSFDTGDSLNFINTSNIEGTYNNGVLTLSVISGQTATTADMQEALRSVTFSTTQDSDASRYIDIVATDNDGASTNIGTTRVDLVNNTPSIDMQDLSDTGSSNSDNITSDDTPTFIITLPTIYTANSTLNLYDVDGNIIGTVTVQQGQSTTASVTVSQRPTGLQTIITKVIDASGDTSKDSAEAEIEIYIDKTAPTFEANQIFNYVENSSDSDILGKVEVSDLSGIETFSITSGNDNGYFAIDNQGNITLTSTGETNPVESNDFETGANSYDLTIEVTDNAGNVKSEVVTLKVTDADEEVPVFNTTSYSYTENKGLNSIVATLDASDDIGIVSYKFKYSDNTTFSTISEDGYYTIDANGNIKITQAGIASNMNDFENGANSGTYDIQISDLVGNDIESAITLNVTDINDAPTLDSITIGTVEDVSTGNSNKSNLSGTLSSNDEDGDTLTYSIVNQETSTESGFDKKVVGTYGTLHINSSTGAYEFIVDEKAVNELGPNDAYSENFNISVSDGNLSDTKTFTINILGANDAPTIEIVSDVSIVEGDTASQDISLSGNISFDDIDNTSDTVSITVANNVAPIWDGGTIDSTLATSLQNAFSVNLVTDANVPDSTTWAYDITGVDLTFLNANETITFSYDVTATDSNNATSTKTITFTINGQASTPTITSANSEGIVVEAGGVSNGTAGTNSISKTLSAVDSDANTTFTWSGDASGTYGTFAIDSSTGEWTYTLDNSLAATQALQVDDNVTETFTVTVNDDGVSGNTDTQDVTITIKGTNDNPVLSAITPLSYTETDGNDTFTSQTGTLSSSDVDSDDTKVYSIASSTSSSISGYDKSIVGSYGTLHFNSLTGTYKYIPDDAKMEAAYSAQTDTFAFVVTDSKGSTDTQDLVINITGVNDTPTISVVTDGISDRVTKYETNSAISASGELTISDLDLAQSVTTTVLSTSATLNSSSISNYTNQSSWLTFTNATVLDNSETSDNLVWKFNSGTQAFNTLSAGDELILTYTIQVDDSNGGTATKDITVKIIGTNDAPTLSIEDGDRSTGDIVENNSANRTASGTFTVSEIELNDTVSASITKVNLNLQTTAPIDIIPSNAELLAMLSLDKNEYLSDTSTSSEKLTWNFNSGTFSFDSLAKGEKIVLDYNLKISDGTVDLNDTIKITIIGTDDGFSIDASEPNLAAQVESGKANTLSHTGVITFSDVDFTNRVTVVESLKSLTGLRRDGITALTILSTDRTNVDNGFSITSVTDANSGNINWDYTIAQSNLNFLGAGETATAVFEVKVSDIYGNEITKDVTVTLIGENKIPTISGTNSTTLTEGDNTLSDTITLVASDENVSDTVTASIVSGTVQRNDGSVVTMNDNQLSWLTLSDYTVVGNDASSANMPWEFNSGSEYFNDLASDETLTLRYTIRATDDSPARDFTEEVITIIINGTNDTPVSLDDDVTTPEDDSITIDVLGNDTDADISDNSSNFILDSITISENNHSTGYDASRVTTAISATIVDNKIEFNIGDEFDYLAQGESATVIIDYTMSDNEGLSSSSTATITITGTNDTPVITAIDVEENHTENSQALVTSGTLSIKDIDVSNIVSAQLDSVTVVNGTTVLTQDDLISMFTLDTNDVLDSSSINATLGWSFDSGSEVFDFVAQDEVLVLKYTIKITDSSNGSTFQNVFIRITGVNDNPIIDTNSELYLELGFGEDLEPQNLKDIFKFSDIDLTDKFNFTVSNVPSGIVVDPQTGILSGRPSQSGVFIITVRGTDDEGAYVEKSFEMLVIAPPQNSEPTSEPTGNNTNETSQNIVKEILQEVNQVTSQESILQQSIEIVDIGETSNENNLLLNNPLELNLTNKDTNQDITQTELTTIKNDNTTNPNDKIVQAGMSLNVDNSGKVILSNDAAKAFQTVGLVIDKISINEQNLEVKIIDSRVGQKYIATLADGSDLPDSLTFDPNTGIVNGSLPEGMEELEISIKAISSDGTTRVLNIKIDIKTLKEQSPQAFNTLRDQINAQNHSMNEYGNYVMSLFS